MNEPSLSPSGLLKVYALAVKLIFALVLAVWLVFALTWGAIHGLIVPRIGELRPTLEQLASRALGVPVRIGAITSVSRGLVPSFEFENVALLDPQGRQALRLSRITASLSPQSLWNLGFDQLTLEQPELDIRRTADGRWWVAGLELTANSQGDDGTRDWFFSQTEFVIRKGTVRWTDEQRDAAPLAMTSVDFVLRNPGRRHLLRLDATPPAGWGQRFTLQGDFRQPLLSRHSGRWQNWVGQLHADFAQVDVSQLGRYIDLGNDVKVAQGQGALRAWVDVQRGTVTAVTADLSLQAVRATLGPKLPPLALTSVGGRLSAKRIPDGFEASTQALAFETPQGLRWPGGNALLSWSQAQDKPLQVKLQADKLDLAALSQIAARLPLGTATLTALAAYAPQGLVDNLQASWSGSIEQPQAHPTVYAAQGRVNQLAVAGQQATGLPGIRGASVEFELTQVGGKAKLSIQNGALDLPGVFEEPVLPLEQLTADVMWQVNGAKLAAQLSNVHFANADAQGQLQASWRTNDASAHSRFPGLLDLTGNISRANGARIYRYLPLSMPQYTRDYVRDSVVAGTATDVKLRIKGDLNEMPTDDPKKGEFLIGGSVRNATFAFAPASTVAKGTASWPALTQLNGELVFDRNTMRVSGASSGFSDAPGLQLLRGQAQIADLRLSTVVLVDAEVRGPVDQALGVVNGSPLASLMGNALGRTKASGDAQFKLRLNLPVTSIERSKVVGTATLQGNELQMTPDSPQLSQVRGQVAFSETGFVLVGAQARMLGGEARLEGGMRPAPAGSPKNEPSQTQIRAQGSISAEGLRQARELGFAAGLAQNASGTTTYSASLGFRSGVAEVVVTSNLQGLALGLPAPLNKAADTVLPLRFESALVRPAPGDVDDGVLQDQLVVDIGRLALIRYVRDISGTEPRVLRGSIAVGLAEPEVAPMPVRGVVANINFANVNIDAWEAALNRASGGSPARGGATLAAGASQSYLPSQIAVRARELLVQGRTLRNVVVGGSREGLIWKANLDATELNGYLEYRQSSGGGAGGLYARLARLQLTQSNEGDLDALLDEQPANLPSLDVVVEDLELRGRKLGRLEVEANNRGAGLPRELSNREWRLRKLNLTMPEASFTATGNWAAVNAQALLPGTARVDGRTSGEARRTVMNFRLDIANSGQLLSRFGMKDVVRGGKGRLEGQVSWLGSPVTLDAASLGGNFNVNLEAGQFLKADPGIAKLLGVLSLQSLPRRLTLDFRDVFSEGFSFDFVRGDVSIEQGIAATNNLQMKGVNAAVLMDGKADIIRETQDIRALVVPEIDAGTASLVAAVINPAIGITTFLAQLFFRKPLIQAATQEFQISGSWADPKVLRVDRKAAAAPEAGQAPPAAPPVLPEVSR
jgi:uncharacterized protein (TIGR02099 family)